MANDDRLMEAIEQCVHDVDTPPRRRTDFVPAMNPLDYLAHWMRSCIPSEPATAEEDAAIMRNLDGQHTG
ncbi:hypothetical protein GGF32_009688, partial [Allomyces javanicus]